MDLARPRRRARLHGPPGATGAAYLVRHGATAILLDLGQGSSRDSPRRSSRARSTRSSISHLHPDHFIDLVPLRHYLRWQFHPRRRVRVVGAGGLATGSTRSTTSRGSAAAALDVDDLDPGAPRRRTASASRRGRVRHTADSYAFRGRRRRRRRRRASSTRATAARPTTSRRSSGPATTLLVEARSAPGPVPPGAEHLDAPAVAALAARDAARPGPADPPPDGPRPGGDGGRGPGSVRRAGPRSREPGLEVAIGG